MASKDEDTFPLRTEPQPCPGGIQSNLLPNPTTVTPSNFPSNFSFHLPPLSPLPYPYSKLLSRFRYFALNPGSGHPNSRNTGKIFNPLLCPEQEGLPISKKKKLTSCLSEIVRTRGINFHSRLGRGVGGTQLLAAFGRRATGSTGLGGG